MIRFGTTLRPMSREVRFQYQDPLDAVWLGAAARVGLRVNRSNEVFAATDGRGVLTLGEEATLDADDCLAQMIFHELCHSLVQGPDSFTVPDWGLDNVAPGDEVREHACLRVQAVLAGARGLREVLGPTTDFRAYYDALPADPLIGDEPSVPLAVAALGRVDQAPWGPHLVEALDATRVMAAAAAPYAAPGSLWSRFSPAPAPPRP